MIEIETAKVFRGGGRRWFTKRAAIRAEAARYFRERHLCECESADHATGTPGYVCENHGDFREKFIRRVMRMILAKMTPND